MSEILKQLPIEKMNFEELVKEAEQHFWIENKYYIIDKSYEDDTDKWIEVEFDVLEAWYYLPSECKIIRNFYNWLIEKLGITDDTERKAWLVIVEKWYMEAKGVFWEYEAKGIQLEVRDCYDILFDKFYEFTGTKPDYEEDNRSITVKQTVEDVNEEDDIPF